MSVGYRLLTAAERPITAVFYPKQRIWDGTSVTLEPVEFRIMTGHEPHFLQCIIQDVGAFRAELDAYNIRNHITRHGQAVTLKEGFPVYLR